MNYDEMPAGMEMDRLIAEKVLGREVAHRGPTGIPSYDPPDGALFFMDTIELVPLYSTSHAAVTAMLQQKSAEEAWPVLAEIDLLKTPSYTAHVAGHTSSAETLPLAFCRAALKAVG